MKQILKITSAFGEKIDAENVLPEYPRPQMKRNSYLNLNGYWKYVISDEPNLPDCFEEQILVPFSPECTLSGVNKTVFPDNYLWYEKDIILPEGFYLGDGYRVLLHFGAIDQIADVYINSVHVIKHTGGYLPFSIDISRFLPQETIRIHVRVRDYTDCSFYSRGKQTLKPQGIFYTPQSGIWQTVWMECVPNNYITNLCITPFFDESKVHIKVDTMEPCECIAIFEKEEIAFYSDNILEIPIRNMRAWSPEDPYLYSIFIQNELDCVESYFAMRKFSSRKEGNSSVFCLNNEPYFQSGVLDQGYYPESLMTYPSDEAIAFEIRSLKTMGFNMIRKHVKIEPLRWYYQCDRLGMIVWQDIPNGGRNYSPLVVTLPVIFENRLPDRYYFMFGRKSLEGRENYFREMEETIAHLSNCPCIAVWVPFNEGWGQFDALNTAERIHSLDFTRLIDHASGWHDQGGGDFKSRHVYFKRYKIKKDKYKRIQALTEFGGYHLKIEGHNVSSKTFGYKKFHNTARLEKAIVNLYYNEIIPATRNGLCACIYTQLSDVEEEMNGLFTYDRKILKTDIKTMQIINRDLNLNFLKWFKTDEKKEN